MVHSNPISIKGHLFDYMSFLTYMSNLAENGLSSGNSASPVRIEYTKLNYARLKRLDQQIQLSDELIDATINLRYPCKWYIITESWCGDSGQILPVIGKLSLLNNVMIDLTIILRDENPDWMHYYHTNGAHSIPKLIIRNANGSDLTTWGPRPEPANQMMVDWKANKDIMTHDEFEKNLHAWYTKDKTAAVQMELLSILKQLNSLQSKNHNNKYSSPEFEPSK